MFIASFIPPNGNAINYFIESSVRHNKIDCISFKRIGIAMLRAYIIAANDYVINYFMESFIKHHKMDRIGFNRIKVAMFEGLCNGGKWESHYLFYRRHLLDFIEWIV